MQLDLRRPGWEYPHAGGKTSASKVLKLFDYLQQHLFSQN
jgi:hypothetical protein